MSTETQQTPRKLYLVSLGCSKAQVDAEAAVGRLLAEGYELVGEADGADLVVVNTCSFIEPAIRESVDTVLELGQLRQAGEIGELVVSGCLVDRYGNELVGELPEVDRFLPSGAFREWAAHAGNTRKILASPGPALPGADDPRVLLNASHYAYVKIAEGCDRRCSFCTIPQIRGPQRSRSADDILRELRHLAESGVREAVLVSQDTVRWGRDRNPRSALADLLQAIEDADGLPDWVRLHYLYPEPSALGLVELLTRGRRIVPYVDVPIQHAADPVLAAMRRAHRADDARRLITALREADPNIAIRTTVIVGFPGETPADVDALCDFLDEAAFDAVGVFTYWDEDSADASKLTGKIDEEERYARAAAVEAAAGEAAERAVARRVGQRVRVLVDGRDPVSGAWIGRHAGQAPDVDGVVELRDFAGPAGNFIDVDLIEAAGFDLIGRPTGLAQSIPIL